MRLASILVLFGTVAVSVVASGVDEATLGRYASEEVALVRVRARVAGEPAAEEVFSLRLTLDYTVQGTDSNSRLLLDRAQLTRSNFQIRHFAAPTIPSWRLLSKFMGLFHEQRKMEMQTASPPNKKPAGGEALLALGEMTIKGEKIEAPAIVAHLEAMGASKEETASLLNAAIVCAMPHKMPPERKSFVRDYKLAIPDLAVLRWRLRFEPIEKSGLWNVRLESCSASTLKTKWSLPIVVTFSVRLRAALETDDSGVVQTAQVVVSSHLTVRDASRPSLQMDYFVHSLRTLRRMKGKER